MIGPARKKAPCVDLRTDVHKDERFAALAQIAGFNRYEAIGRMHALWSWCIDRGLIDAPLEFDGYVVPERVVRQFLGESGVAALLAEGCDELALGVEVSGGRYYLRGTSGYVGERRRLLRTSQAGGLARTNGPRDGGRFVGANTNDQPTGSSGQSVAARTNDQPQSTGSPATVQPQSQPLTSQDSSQPPARTSDLPSSLIYIRERHQDTGRVCRDTWQYASQCHTALRQSGIDTSSPVWSPMPDANHPGWQLLLDRACELLVMDSGSEAIGKCRHRVDVAVAMAKRDSTLRWFNPVQLFKAESFAIGCAMSIDAASEKQTKPNQRPAEKPRRSVPL